MFFRDYVLKLGDFVSPDYVTQIFRKLPCLGQSIRKPLAYSHLGYYAHIGKPSCWPTGALLYSKPFDNLYKLIKEGIQKGWIFKGNKIFTLAKAQGLSELENTVKSYD